MSKFRKEEVFDKNGKLLGFRMVLKKGEKKPSGQRCEVLSGLGLVVSAGTLLALAASCIHWTR